LPKSHQSAPWTRKELFCRRSTSAFWKIQARKSFVARLFRT